MKIYLVGGAVRDNLLGLPIKDRDWVIVNGQPELLEEQGYTQVGKDFPVYLHPHTKEEYALARTERKIGKGYSGFSCYSAPDVTLEQDLLRRDLTINAIARTHDGQIIDPYHGVNDLSKRILRHVSPAFSEDPLRILRVARFAARFHHFGFTIASETLKLMTTLSPELVEISPERVWQETEKALHTDYPHVYFKTLRECGALKVLFPEIDILFGVPAPEKWHPEIDTGIHTLLTLEQSALLSPSVNIRFSALCHDIGKGLTPKELWPHHYGHCRGGIAPLKVLCDRLRVPNQIRELALLMCEFHDLVHILKEVKPITLLTLFDHLDAWRKPERIEALAIIGTADYRGRLGWHEKPYPQADYLRDAFRVANTVDVAPIVTSGFQGKAIREELTRQRLAILTEWKTGKIRSNNSSLCSTSLE